MKRLLLFVLVFAGISCKLIPKEESAESQIESQKITADAHSFSQPEKALVTHLDLDLFVDFAKTQISAKASWTFKNITKADSIIFDTRDLAIERITLGDEQKPTTFTLGTQDNLLGRQLSIKIDNSTTKVNIYYTTAPNAAALQWLTPQQTAGKQQPFLFTQSEAILARTWIPCYDGPGVRFTYNARVTVPKNLLALMSAENPRQKNDSGVYHFNQPYAVPAYLMALAVGDITFKSIDNRTGVYAERPVTEKAAFEFADMGKMVSAAEKLYGPYRWGRYDILVLPPSFPFGGMENPMLTFATPTVIAGDRSLVSLVAHELAHSWSGNLVTNATWNDFWLNEGFTMYFERRITEALYGKEEKEMQEVLGFADLKRSLEEMGDTNADTRLKVNLNGRDPDLGVSDIAYEKGYLFLRYVEDIVGRTDLDNFLNRYFTEHAFQSMTTEKFVEYFKSRLPNADKINIEEWIYKPGLPAKIPIIQSSLFKTLDTLISKYDSTRSINFLSNKINSTNERLYFLNHLPDRLSPADMQTIDKAFGFTESHNAEVQFAWYLQAIKHQYKFAYPYLENFLINVGRRKFVMPLFKELNKTIEGREFAIRIYQNARPNYHAVTYRSVDELLNITNEKSK